MFSRLASAQNSAHIFRICLFRSAAVRGHLSLFSRNFHHDSGQSDKSPPPAPADVFDFLRQSAAPPGCLSNEQDIPEEVGSSEQQLNRGVGGN